MKTILRTNAIPVYSFLSFINAKQQEGELEKKIKILDCGAGGPVPPLALFYEHGFEVWGIDISGQQLELAKQYCAKREMQINLKQADMRQIPFDDESFDCVYEHYSMCHLSKNDTKKAISEMRRVTIKNGFAFLGLISMDSWPKSLFGNEQKYGADESKKGKNDSGFHCLLTDEDADELVAEWEIVSKEKHTKYLRETANSTSLDTWMQLYNEEKNKYTRESWHQLYHTRLSRFNYTHIFYFLKNSRY